MAVSPDGRYIASGGSDKKIRLWDSETGKLIKVFENRTTNVPSLSFSPDSKMILAGTSGPCGKNICYIYEVPSGKILQEFDYGNSYVYATAFSPDGRFAATGGGKDRPIHIYDSATGKTIHKLIGKGRVVFSVGFGLDGTSIAWGYTNIYKNVCDRGPLEYWLRFCENGQKGNIRFMGDVDSAERFSRAVAEQDEYKLKPEKCKKRLKLLKKGTIIHLLQPKSRFHPAIRSYTYTPDSRYVIWGGSYGELVLFETKTGREVRHFYGHTGTIWSVAVSPDGSLLVSGSEDQTIRLWDIETGQNLFSFFHGSDNEWVAWTPEGFFNASPDGAKYIGYVINRGKDTAPDYIGIEQVFDLFYRPDLLALKIEGGHEDILQAELDRIRIDEILAGGMPPSITFLSPPTESTLRERDTLLRMSVTDRGGGIGKIVYRINGITIGADQYDRGIKLSSGGKTKEQPIIVEKLVTLQPGDNHITVVAYNERNEIESRPASIRLFLKDVISERPSLYIVTIGINRYRDHALELSYSVPDAHALAEEMRLRGQYLFKEVIIEDLFDEEATLEGIEKAFRGLSKDVKTNDVFVFYVAGHGLTLDGKYHFMPWELVFQNEDSVRENSLTQERMQKLLAMIPALKSVVLLDTCNSGAFAKPMSRGLTEKTALDKLMRATGRATIASSSESQIALEGYEGHGVFTYVLIQGLKGDADGKADRNGETSINELAEYVTEEVPKITYKKWGYEQFPMQNLYGRSFPIGLVK